MVSVVFLLFRIRVAVMVLLHIIGFLTPWNYFTAGNRGSLWLAASTQLARTGWISLAAATVAITLLGLAFLTTGTVLRVWGTAYPGSNIRQETVMQGNRLVATGPYAFLHNPLYLGTWFVTLATSLLMPPDGAAFFLAANTAFLVFLIAAQERLLLTGMGQSSFTAHTGGRVAQSQWLHALLNETYPVGFTLCFAIFAWRYNARILIQCMLICFGVSLIVSALNGTAKDTNAA